MITLVLLTYKRTEYAIRTVRAASAHLKSSEPLQWYIADDGSPKKHLDAVLAELTLPLVGKHSSRAGYGRNANRAWSASISRGEDVTLWLEDDWELRADLDLDPLVALLRTTNVGMIRLGYLSAGLAGKTFGAADRLYWQLDKTSTAQVFTGHPALRHARYHQVYGPYPEGFSPGDTELMYGYTFRDTPSPVSIVWPCDYPSNGLFGHIGEVRTETL